MADPFVEAQDETDRTSPQGRKRILGQIADLLDRNGIDVADIGKVHRINVWQAMSKDDEGNPVVTDLTGVQLSPEWAEGPTWPVVAPAKPCVIKFASKPLTGKTAIPGFRTVLLPDPQIGFRRMDDGELVPLHDEKAIACALELLSLIKPDRIVWLGDHVDGAEWSSKFVVLPEFVLTTQPMVDAAHRFLAECIAAAGPQAEQRFLLEGNHDNRIPIAITRNAIAALRLRRANTPEGWPVLSLPHLLRLDDLGITYVDGYPAGRVKIADAHGTQAPLYALHGERLSMEKQAKVERISTVQGHAHHFSMHSETYDLGDGEAVDVEAWSLGALCRRDGAVPSTKGGTDSRGRFINRVESWQHGIAVVTEDEDGWDLQPIRIREGRARWQNQVVTA